MFLDQGRSARVFTFEIEAADIYAALGRVLDRSRVTGLRLVAVTTAQTDDGGCFIMVTVDTTDRDIVDRLARQFGEMFGVTSVTVERAASHRSSQSARSAALPPAHRVPGSA